MSLRSTCTTPPAAENECAKICGPRKMRSRWAVKTSDATAWSGEVALMSPQKAPSSVNSTWLPESPLITGRAAAGPMERIAMSGSFLIVSAIVVEISRSSLSPFKSSSSRRPSKIACAGLSACTTELPKSCTKSWAEFCSVF